MYCASDYAGVTEASETRANARLDEEYEATKAALEADEREAERLACAIAEAEEDAMHLAARAKDDDAIEARIEAARTASMLACYRAKRAVRKGDPVTIALDGWINSQIAARPLAYAFIAPGIVVRTGTGKKRRAA
jgi:hypothetical protein